MTYNLSLYNNATGIMGIFEATNYMTGNILSILFLLSVSLLIFWALAKNNVALPESLAISSLTTLFLSLLLRVRVFNTVPMIPDWFIITVLLILSFSVGALYLQNKR